MPTIDIGSSGAKRRTSNRQGMHSQPQPGVNISVLCTFCFFKCFISTNVNGALHLFRVCKVLYAISILFIRYFFSNLQSLICNLKSVIGIQCSVLYSTVRILNRELRELTRIGFISGRTSACVGQVSVIRG